MKVTIVAPDLAPVCKKLVTALFLVFPFQGNLAPVCKKISSMFLVSPFQGDLTPWATCGVCRASVGTLPPVSRYWIRLKSNDYF